MKLKRMNTALGKQILSLVREGDFAHPGEEEAIDMVFEGIPKDPDRLLLDVGCGLGGTAHYLQENGYGKVTGLELDEGIISMARNRYPDLNLVQGDVCEVDKLLNKKFDLIYHFCSFYAFPDKLKALKALRKVAHEKTELIIFDYAINGWKRVAGIVQAPLDLKEIDGMFELSGWKKLECIDISKYYEEEYKKLVQKIKRKRDEIIKISDKDSYEFVENEYETIYSDYCEGKLLAVILKAEVK